MPSHEHEGLLLLFRNRPTLAAELLQESLHMELPRYTAAQINSENLCAIQPTEYRADLVAVLLDDEKPVLGIVVEAQLSDNARKPFAWPAYVTNLRSRLECPVCLLVVTADEAVARWAARPIHLGGGNWFTPRVLSPSRIPAITDEARARADPELAVLSAMAHGLDDDVEKAAQIVAVTEQAIYGLDEKRSELYFDLVVQSLSEAAARALQTMNPATYQYKSDFAKRYFAQGRTEGEASGRAAIVARLLARRFGPLQQEIQVQLAAASITELDAIGERLLTAATLQEALGPSGASQQQR